MSICYIAHMGYSGKFLGNSEEAFLEKGLKVGIWTANSKEAMNFCVSLKPDFIESDYFCSQICE